MATWYLATIGCHKALDQENLLIEIATSTLDPGEIKIDPVASLTNGQEIMLDRSMFLLKMDLRALSPLNQN